MLNLDKFYFYQNDEPESVVDGGEAISTEQPTEDAPQSVTAESVAKLQNALKRQREESRELQRQLKEAQHRYGGVNVEEYETLKQQQEEAKAKAEELQRAQLEKQQKYDELLQLERQKADEKVAEYQRQQSELQQQLTNIQKQAQESAIEQAFTKSWNDPDVSGNPKLQGAAFAQLRTEGRLKYNQTTRQVEVVNPITQDPVIDELGAPISIKGYLNSHLKNDTPDFFIARQRGGTGASPTAGSIGGSGSPVIPFEERLKMGKKRAYLTSIKNKK